MTGFAVQLIIGNLGDFFKPPGILIPVPHPLPGEMKTAGKKGSQAISGLRG
jgi:hypothetical protein